MRDEFADAWLELDADPAVRVIVHTGNGRAFQTGVDVAEIASDGIGFERYRQSVEDWDLHFTAWHQQVWKPVITAVNGICAGGGVPLGRRRRHRDRRVATPSSSTPTCRSARSCRSRRSASCARCRSRRSCAWRSSAGTSGCPPQRAYELGMICEIVDPPERLREQAQELGETIAKNSPGRHGRDQAGAVGRARARAHRRLPGRRQASWCRCGATPTRTKGRGRSPRSASPSEWTGRDDLADLLPAGDDDCRRSPSTPATRTRWPSCASGPRRSPRAGRAGIEPGTPSA